MTERTDRLSTIFVVAALIVAGAPAMAGDDSNLEERAAMWMEKYNSGDLSGVAALYAEDGERNPPNAESVSGREAILAFLETQRERGLAKVNVEVTSAHSSCDMAWARGTYQIVGDDGAELDHGKWVNVSKKVGDDWVIQSDIWNSDLPLP